MKFKQILLAFGCVVVGECSLESLLPGIKNGTFSLPESSLTALLVKNCIA
jgi:hypothetical protein